MWYWILLTFKTILKFMDFTEYSIYLCALYIMCLAYNFLKDLKWFERYLHMRCAANRKRQTTMYSACTVTCSNVNPLLDKLHWLLVEQRIRYKIVVLSFQVRSASTPAYLNRHIQTRQRARDTRSSATPALFEPFTRTNYAERAFRCSAPAAWNSLLTTTEDSARLCHSGNF